MSMALWIAIGVATIIVIGIVIAWWSCCNGRDDN